MLRSTLVMMFGISACHSAMMNDEEAMRGYLEDTRRETTHHLTAVRTVTTMPGMRDEMTRHRDGMGPMMIDIDTTMGSMGSHCDGSGMDDMRAMHGGLDSEMLQHAASMDAIDVLPEATTEVERHAEAMLAMMDGMGGAMGRMRCR